MNDLRWYLKYKPKDSVLAAPLVWGPFAEAWIECDSGIIGTLYLVEARGKFYLWSAYGKWDPKLRAEGTLEEMLPVAKLLRDEMVQKYDPIDFMEGEDLRIELEERKKSMERAWD